MSARHTPREQAEAWNAKLSRTSITTAEVHEFFAWRKSSANEAAFKALQRERQRSSGRFVVLPDSAGFSVIDVWTGEPAVFANAAQTGISAEDAEDLADLLSRRGAGRNGSVLQ